MAYTPKTWECGDTITADELNRMEEGISSAQGGGGTSQPLILRFEDKEEPCERGTHTVRTYNYSWTEIKDALIAGRPAYVSAQHQDGTDVIFDLVPIRNAWTDNNEAFCVSTTNEVGSSNGTEFYFVSATDKLFNITVCTDK